MKMLAVGSMFVAARRSLKGIADIEPAKKAKWFGDMQCAAVLYILGKSKGKDAPKDLDDIGANFLRAVADVHPSVLDGDCADSRWQERMIGQDKAKCVASGSSGAAMEFEVADDGSVAPGAKVLNRLGFKTDLQVCLKNAPTRIMTIREMTSTEACCALRAERFTSHVFPWRLMYSPRWLQF